MAHPRSEDAKMKKRAWHANDSNFISKAKLAKLPSWLSHKSTHVFEFLSCDIRYFCVFGRITNH